MGSPFFHFGHALANSSHALDRTGVRQGQKNVQVGMQGAEGSKCVVAMSFCGE